MTGQCLDAEAEARIIATAKAIVEKSAQPMRAILIDTVAAACGGREQTPGLQGELRDAGNRIAAATGAIVCWIQHEGKTSHNGPIGYLDLANSCSTWWRVEEREDGSRVVHVDKANRGPVHVPLFAFRLMQFTAGQDDNGKDIVLCDLEEVALDGALASAPRQPFGKPQNENKRAAGQGSLQKLMVTELRKLESRHPDGVDKASAEIGFRAEGGRPAQGQGRAGANGEGSHPEVQSNPPFPASAGHRRPPDRAKRGRHPGPRRDRMRCGRWGRKVTDGILRRFRSVRHLPPTPGDGMTEVVSSPVPSPSVTCNWR